MSAELVGGSNGNQEGEEGVERTSHVGELFRSTFDIIAILGLDGILNGTRRRIVDTEDGTLNQLDLTGGITSQAATAAAAAASRGTTGSLTLAPGFCGGSLTSRIGRRDTARDTKGRGRVIHILAGVDRTSRVRVMVGSIGSIAFGQAVARTRTSDGGDVSLVNIVEGALSGQKTMGSFFFRATILVVDSVVSLSGIHKWEAKFGPESRVE